MAEIHVYLAEGEEAVYPEHRIPELMREGLLPPDGHYWHKGMSQWRPLREFEPTAHAFVPHRHTERLPEAKARATREIPEPRQAGIRTYTGRQGFRRKPYRITRTVQILLVVCALVAAGGIYLDLVRIHLLGDASTGDGDLAKNEMLIFDLAMGAIATNTALLVCYLVWIYWAVLNCRTFTSMVTFTPAWAVGCHLIPIMNLGKPYQVMQEIWKVSSQPRRWQSQPISLLVCLWWALFLLLPLLGAGAYFLIQYAEKPADFIIALWVTVGAEAIQIIWCAIFFAVVAAVIQKQTRLVNASREQNRKKTA